MALYFYTKKEAETVAEKVCAITNTTNLVDACEAVLLSQDLEHAIADEFGVDSDEVIADCHRYLATGSNEINSPFA